MAEVDQSRPVSGTAANGTFRTFRRCTDRRRPLDLTLGQLMQGLRRIPLSNTTGIHRSPFLKAENGRRGCGLLIGNSRHEGAGDLPGRHGVHLRRLGDKDLPLVEEHLLGLDMPSRNSRFHCGFGDAAVAAYVRDLDPNRDVLFGAIDPGTGRIVGLAEARPANGPKTVDLATSVLPSHRKRGLAHALVTRAAGVASDQGATAADLRFAPGNLAANRIAARLGASFRAPGIAVVRLPLCEPLAEGVARQMGERGSFSGMTAKGPDAAACVHSTTFLHRHHVSK